MSTIRVPPAEHDDDDASERMIQAQRMESLGRLAGSVAHDFNNLLTGIIGYASILEREVEPEHSGRRAVDEIRKAAELAKGLTQQLLAYSRKNAKRIAVTDVNEVLDGLSYMLQRLIGEQLTLQVERGVQVPPVLIDQAQLEQVILNLVLNARDASGLVGRILLSTQVVEVSEAEARESGLQLAAPGGRFATITIQDNGEGMSEDVLNHLFQPFYTTKPVGKGTGLGLASANRIVRQAGGFIRVHSEVGRGTTMVVLLPEAVREPALAQTDAPVEPPPAEMRGTETVLVTEDDETVRNFVQEALAFYGYRPLMASDPAAALRIVTESAETIDAALTDVVLPDMSGMHLAQHLQELRPNLRVIFMSGYMDVRTGRSALPPDAAFLRKPFQPDDLARMLRQVLDRSVPARAAGA